jgi:hypothetical protein
MMETWLIQPTAPLGPTNFLKYAVLSAYQLGIPLPTIVVLLLFPLVTALIAAARYLIGLKGFGIFTPAMLSVAFLAIGIVPGVSLFLLILLIATAARLVTLRLKLHYLARMSLLLWFICLGVLVSLFLFSVSLFPILILILLAENFIEVQIGKSFREAANLTLVTFILALGSWALLQWSWLQRVALLQPEFVVLGTFAFNLLVGRFTGLRLLEYRRFNRLLK